MRPLGEALDPAVAESMKEIARRGKRGQGGRILRWCCVDPTLVRGMSYYTGTIFEIAIPEFGGSCGGRRPLR